MADMHVLTPLSETEDTDHRILHLLIKELSEPAESINKAGRIRYIFLKFLGIQRM
jgi:hypothetical protein